MFTRPCCAVLLLLSVGCFQAPEMIPARSANVTPEGGTFELGDGVELSVPSGAVSSNTVVTARAATLSATLSGRALGPAWLLEPEGQTFAVPVTLRLPLDDGASGTARVVIATAPAKGGRFDHLPATREGSGVIARTTHFSIFIPVEDTAIEATSGSDAGHDAGSSAIDAGQPEVIVDAGRPSTWVCSSYEDGGVTVPYCYELPDDQCDVPYQRPDGGLYACDVPVDPYPGMQCSQVQEVVPGNVYGLERVCAAGAALFEQRLSCPLPMSTCDCIQGGTVLKTFTWPGPQNFNCSIEKLMELYKCECGFGGAWEQTACVPPRTAVADSGVAFSKPFGAGCSDATECQSASCYGQSGTTGQFCGRECRNSCPCGWSCLSGGAATGICFPPP